MRRSALIVLVAGIVGVLLFLATREPESAAGIPAPQAGSEVAQARRGVESVAAPGERAELARTEDAAWRVRVLDGSTDAPVAGATVRVIDLSAVTGELAARGVGFDTLEGLRLRREKSVEARTGADGCAGFAVPPARSMVEARAGLEWAYTLVHELPADRCLTLRLAPDRELCVRVVDAEGNPVGGVPVALRRQTDARPSFSWKWTDTQAESGLATFLHFQRRLEQGPGWHALLGFPVRGQELAPVDARTPVEPPLTLALPETGRVHVLVRASDGGLPALEGVELQVEARENGTPVWPDGPWARPQLDARGEARIPWIGLGLELRFALLMDGVELPARALAGPVRAGEELRCELVLPRPTVTFVTGRFVLRDGRAWPAASVRAVARMFPTPDRPQQEREVAVHGDGRFRLEVREARPAYGVRVYRIQAQHPDDRGDLVADVPLDRDVPPEGLELGDVLLDYGELLVSGRVVDAGRSPIEGARFVLSSRVSLGSQEFWPRVQVAGTAATGADGAFALYLPPGAEQPPEELRLSSEAEGRVPDSEREVRRGARGVEIVLSQAGALAGSLELGEGLVQGDVALFLSSGTAQYVPLRPDSTFEATGLLPGTYSLAVRRKGAGGAWRSKPAVLVEDLLVRAGETCRDPRIQALAIENALPSLRIRVVDRASTALQGAAITLAGVADPRASFSGADGVCFVRSERLPVDLEVSAFGFLRQSLAGVDADREVVLEPGIPVRLRTSTRPSGGEPRYLLRVMLHVVDASGTRRGLAWGAEYTFGGTGGRFHFDERGELALRLPAPGEYECDVQVTVLSGGVGRGARVEFAPLPRFRAFASGTEQLIELAIPQEAVEKAIERALR